MNKYEKLIEYIISEQDDLARELFHEIVVEKSRHIYENLMDSVEEEVHQGNKVDELMKDVTADESIHEAGDEMPDDMGGDDMSDMDDMGGDDMGDMDDMGDEDIADMGDEDMGDSDLEDRVVDLESALDELKAEFDKIMGEGGEEEEGEEEGEDGMVREYVEKVATPSNTAEGHEVGAGGSAAIQKKSPALQKANNMGGKAFDLGKASESAPDGQRPKDANNYGTKGRKDHPHAGQFENVPGAKTKGYVNKATAKKGEEGGINKHSIESGN